MLGLHTYFTHYVKVSQAKINCQWKHINFEQCSWSLLLKILIFIILILCVGVCLCMGISTCECRYPQSPGRVSYYLELELQVMWITQPGYWNLNSGSLEEASVPNHWAVFLALVAFLLMKSPNLWETVLRLSWQEVLKLNSREGLGLLIY